MEHLSDLSQVDLTNITVMAPSSIQEEVPQDKLLTVEQLHFAYQENRSILKNINFEINQGERIAIVGKMVLASQLWQKLSANLSRQKVIFVIEDNRL